MARLTNYSMSVIDVIRRVAIIFFLWRGALIIVAFIGLSLSAEYQGTYAHDSDWVYFDKNYLLNSFFRWDADWYDFIAREGYRNHEGVRANAAAFFPLYPLLSRWLAPLLGSHLIAGLFISYASLFLALLVCYKLCLKFYDFKTAERATILILVFPGSFFFSTFYTESLYFFLASASFFYFFKRRYLVSGLFGILSCLTRPTGISLLIAMMASIGFEWLVYKKKPTSSVFFLLLMPLGLLIYMMLLYIWVGDPFAFSSAQSHWGRGFTFPLIPLLQAVKIINFSLPRDMLNTQYLLNWLCAIGFLGIGILMLLRSLQTKADVTLSLWVLFGVMMPLFTGSLDSMVRFCAVLFPAFFFLGRSLQDDTYFVGIVSFFSSLQIAYMLGFMNKFWVV